MADYCMMCGKRLGITNRDSVFDLVRFCNTPGLSSDNHLCKDCSKMIKPLRNVVFGNFSVNDAKQYGMNRDTIVGYLESAPSPVIREAISNRIMEADGVLKCYLNKDAIVKTFAHNLANEFSNMTDVKIMDYYNSTIVRTDEELRFYEFGRQYTSEDNIQAYLRRLNITQLLDVLNNMVDVMRSGTWSMSIPLNRIIYFQDKGDISYTTSVSGGHVTSKSVSVGGAVAGQLLFGNVGAIIGSRIGTGVKSDGVHTTINEHDNRYVVLRFSDAQDQLQESTFDYGMYDVFNQLIPEKEYGYVSIHGSNEKESSNAASGGDLVEQLKQLRSLTDQGILTEEEFEKKKKQLLGI